MLTDEELAEMEQRARRFQGAWTGTSGTLAADVMYLLQERREILAGRCDSLVLAYRERVAPGNLSQANVRVVETRRPRRVRR